MRITRGRRIELEDGTSVEVIGRTEPIGAGLLAWAALDRGARVLAVSEDPSAQPSARASAAASLRAVGARTPTRLGAERRVRARAHGEPPAGYRDSAAPTASDEMLIAFFSVAPTLPLARLFVPTLRAPWPAPVVARLGVELASALEDGPCPRLDPFSIGLADDGAWLLDAGLDALTRPELRAQVGLRGSGAWLGYLPPEAIRRRGVADEPPGDLAARHALGVLLHELLTGAPLYGGQTPLETIVALRRGLPELLSKTVPNIPIDVAACVQALLDHDPLRRPAPALVAATLSPHAAADLAWARPLFRAHARPLAHIPFAAQVRDLGSLELTRGE